MHLAADAAGASVSPLACRASALPLSLAEVLMPRDGSQTFTMATSMKMRRHGMSLGSYSRIC